MPHLSSSPARQDYDDGPRGPSEDMPQLDERGFPIIMGVSSKVAARDNPLQQKMAELRRKQEVRATVVARSGWEGACFLTGPVQQRLLCLDVPRHHRARQEERKKAEKERALREKAGAFAGGMKAKDAAKKEEEKPKAPEPAAAAPVKAKLDSRVNDMVRSE
jgi:hypothetical protein